MFVVPSNSPPCRTSASETFSDPYSYIVIRACYTGQHMWAIIVRLFWLGGWVAGWLGGWVAGWLGGWVAQRRVTVVCQSANRPRWHTASDYRHKWLNELPMRRPPDRAESDRAESARVRIGAGQNRRGSESVPGRIGAWKQATATTGWRRNASATRFAPVVADDADQSRLQCNASDHRAVRGEAPERSLEHCCATRRRPPQLRLRGG